MHPQLIDIANWPESCIVIPCRQGGVMNNTSKKISQLLGGIVISTSCICTAMAEVAPAAQASGRDVPIYGAQKKALKSKAYILVDANSGEVLASKNADTRRHPASLTKLMTMYVISRELKRGRLKLNDRVKISRKADYTGGSSIGIHAGTTVPVKRLINGIIIRSGNDACVAIAEHIAGSEAKFVKMMNREARRLGMTDSHFNNVNGLPRKNHYTTARDLSILARALIENFPEHYSWYGQKWYRYKNLKLRNRNKLLWRNRYVDGMKTGFTNKAGYCAVTSAKNGSNRVISVVMGAPNSPTRHADGNALLNYGLSYSAAGRERAVEAVALPD
jgi:serine-type D-Ala-D-Ala carboxypeptidase (penicillin-binding protein 5/6)